MTYTAPKLHKNGYHCDRCSKQATVSTEAECRDGTGCTQAKAEADARYDGTDWTHVQHPLEREQHLFALAKIDAEAEERRLLGLEPVDHSHTIAQHRDAVAALDANHAERLAAAKAQWRTSLDKALEGHRHPVYLCETHQPD